MRLGAPEWVRGASGLWPAELGEAPLRSVLLAGLALALLGGIADEQSKAELELRHGRVFLHC